MPDDTPESARPKRIGTYKILQLLGQGGMGEVYEAEQTEPVQRRVALKVIKLGMDTKQVVARFEAERQALAVMDHPNIARVFDGGATPDGRPYFVMELVKGAPLTRHCDNHKLSTRDRLSLFTQVCAAVQHAHQKGVIHRDLKPSNVLVAAGDAGPVPKVIDFGIAKAVGHDLTDKTLVTRLDQALGTPEYMSPEQAEMTGLDVDARTDIYSLGVMLYELLVGALPHDLRGVAALAARMAIVEHDAPRPSHRLTTLPGDERETVARYRLTDPQTLQRTLEGDLDWVVMKCLEKDRTRRYQTANALAMELGRYLADEPVLARPPSARYRLGKFVRRNRVAVAAGAIAALALVAGAGAAVTGMLRAQRAQAEAARQAAAAEQVSEFLVGLFEVSDPSEARGNEVRAREILDAGAERIRTDLAAQPRVQSRLMRTMGRVYQQLGLLGRADSLYQGALAARRSTDGGSDTLLLDLAILRTEQGRYPEAESLYTGALALREQRLGTGHEDVARVLSNLGTLYRRMGRYDDAEETLRRALAAREAALGPRHLAVSRSLNALGNLLSRQQRYAEAESVFRRSLDIKEAELASDHPDIANTLNNLAIVFAIEERLEEALPLFERTLEIREKIYEPDHPAVAAIVNNLASLNRDMGRHDRAAVLFERSLRLKEATLEPDHPDVAVSLQGLGQVRAAQGRDAEAEDLFRRALAIRERALGLDHPFVASTLEDLSELLQRVGRTVEALELEGRARAIREAAGDP